MLFGLQRLTIPRQRRVFRALNEAQSDKAFVKTLQSDTRAALESAVTAGAPLDSVMEISPLVVDSTTDSMLSAFESYLLDIERLTVDRVARLSDAAAEKRADAISLRQLSFPKGATEILDLSMGDQLKAMNDIVDVLNTDKTAQKCIKNLGVEWIVERIVAHLEPYARAVRSSDGRALSNDSDAFHTALTKLAVKVAAHHDGDAEIEKRLLGMYQVELDGQQQDERETRKRAADKKKVEAPK